MVTSILAPQTGARQQWGLEVTGGSQTRRQIIPLITRLCAKTSPTPSPNHRSRIVPPEGSHGG